MCDTKHRKDPEECGARYENDVCVRTATCYFCQREVDDQACVDGVGLCHTKIWWYGKAVSTLICVRCMDFLQVPPTAPASSEICDFCGYPGGNIMPYKWNWDHLEFPYTQYGEIEIYRQDLSLWTMRVFGSRYMCCQQCLEFFGRNPLQE